MEKINSKNQKGMITLELLIAFAILVLNITAITLLINGGQSLYIDSETNTEAITIADKAIEKARADARNDFNLVNPYTTTETSGSLTYTKKLEVSQIDLFTKELTSTVSWLAEGGRTLSIKLTTLLTNLGGDTCGSVLLGDWTNPQMYSWELGKDILSDTSSGFPIEDIDVYKNKVYIVVNNSNGNNFPTFFILNIDPDDPTSKPTLDVSIDNDSTVKTGLKSIAVTEDYAYVANGLGPTKGQLQIIDLSPVTPLVITTFIVPGVTGTGSQAIGQTIFYKDGYVYLGLAKTASGPEFNIIDIGGGTGSVSNPIWIGGYSVGNGVNAIYVKNDYAYFASPNSEELTVLDISNKTSPTRVSGFNAPDSVGNGKSIYIVGPKIYLGRTVTSSNPEFYIIDNSNPASIPTTALGTKEINSSVNGILTRDYLTFLLTNSDFEIWNTSDPTNITQWASPLPLPAGNGTSSDCEGNNIFFASLPSNDKGYIAIVTSGEPSSYTLSNTGDISVDQGNSETNTITRTLTSGSPNVTLGVSGLPSNTTYSFTNNPCEPNPTCLSELTISTSSSTPTGTYPITITGNGGVTTSFNLIVNPGFDYNLTNSGDITVKKKFSGSTVATRTLVSGTSVPVTLSISGLPSRTSLTSITTNPCNPTCSSTITISTQNSATPGTYPIVVTGSPDGLAPRNTTFNLIITN